MRTNPGFITGVAVLVLSLAYAPAIAASPLANNPFFAMCTGTKDAAHATPASQVALVKALGYSGTDLIGVTGLAEVLGEIDRQESRFFALYTGGNIDVFTDFYGEMCFSVNLDIKGLLADDELVVISGDFKGAWLNSELYCTE